MLLRLAFLLCAMQWVLAAPLVTEPHFYSIDEVPSKDPPKPIRRVYQPSVYRRVMTSSKALLDDLVGAITGRPTPAATPFPAASGSNSTNSTGVARLRARADLNSTILLVNGTVLRLANESTSDPATLAKRRMAIPKWTSPFANSKIIVESPRGQHETGRKVVTPAGPQ